MANTDDGYREGVGQSAHEDDGQNDRQFTQGNRPSVPAAVKSIEDQDSQMILGDTMTDILDRVDAEDDLQRIKAGCALVNTFNYAIQVQAGRTQWQPSDYHRFVRALLVLDSIGREAIAGRRAATVAADVKEAYAGRNQVEQRQEPQPQTQPVPQPVRPSQSNPMSSLPKQGNSIRRGDTIVDDRRMPMR